MFPAKNIPGKVKIYIPRNLYTQGRKTKTAKKGGPINLQTLVDYQAWCGICLSTQSIKLWSKQLWMSWPTRPINPEGGRQYDSMPKCSIEDGNTYINKSGIKWMGFTVLQFLATNMWKSVNKSLDFSTGTAHWSPCPPLRSPAWVRRAVHASAVKEWSKHRSGPGNHTKP